MRKRILKKLRPNQRGLSAPLALLLLTSLVWVTSAEFNHQHGLTFGKRAAPSANAEHNKGATKVDTDNPNGGSSRTTTPGDCAICQVHQNLSTTLFNSPLYVAPILTQDRVSLSPVAVAHGDFVANQHGRAPPVFSLS